HHRTPLPPSFFLTHTAPTDTYTLSLHDALPILDAHDAAHAGSHQQGWRNCRPNHAACAVDGAVRRWRSTPRCCGAARPWISAPGDRKSTRLNSSHLGISYAVFCLKKKKKIHLSV